MEVDLGHEVNTGSAADNPAYDRSCMSTGINSVAIGFITTDRLLNYARPS
jgi:hypothetical protein